MNEKMGKKQLILHTFSLLAGFMVWTLLAPLFPEIVKDIPEAAEQQALIVALCSSRSYDRRLTRPHHIR